MNKNRAFLCGLLVLLLVRLVAMIWVPLTDPTEARYAEIARKMIETNNWITPQFDYGVPFWAKPSLHTWLSALGIELFGASAFAARLGILLTAIATLSILWRWATTVTSANNAAAATIITASSGLFFVASAFVMTDMVMTLGIIACMAGFYNGVTRADANRRLWGWLFFFGLAIGLLAKGPVAVVLSMAPVTLWMIWRGGWKDLLRLPWIGGVLMVMVLVIPWYVAAEIATPGFLHYFLIGEHIQRFLQPGWTGDLYGAGRAHPKGTIWLYWLVATLPWSPLLPVLLWRLRKDIRQEDAMLQSDPREKSGSLCVYLLLFALTPLLFFTMAANILLAYVLPGLPAAALLAVILWNRSGAAQAFWLKLGVAEVAVIFLGLTVAMGFNLTRSELPTEADLIRAFPSTGRLAILDARSFSAEFYTQGKITRINTPEQLSAWLTPGDGVLVQKGKQQAFLAQYGDTLKPLAENRKYQLFIPIVKTAP